MSVFYFAAVILLISHHVVSSPAHVQIVSPFSPRRSNFPLDNVSSQEDGDRSVSEQDMGECFYYCLYLYFLHVKINDA